MLDLRPSETLYRNHFNNVRGEAERSREEEGEGVHINADETKQSREKERERHAGVLNSESLLLLLFLLSNLKNTILHTHTQHTTHTHNILHTHSDIGMPQTRTHTLWAEVIRKENRRH